MTAPGENQAVAPLHGGTVNAPTQPPDVDERLFAVIVANMFAGIQLVRASDATILYANPRFAQMFGYEPGELEGRPVSILNAPGGRSPEDVARDIIACLNANGFWRGQVENIRKDGPRMWCDANVTSFDHPQYGTLWVTVQLDVTAVKRAEAALRRSEERLGLILEATGAVRGTGTSRAARSTSASTGRSR